MVKMIKCEACGKDISENAECCPGCGNPISQKVKFKWYHTIFILLGLLSMLMGGILILIGVSEGYMPGMAMLFTVLFIVVGLFVIVAPFCKRR